MCVCFTRCYCKFSFFFRYADERFATRFRNRHGNAHESHMLKFNCSTNVETRKCTYGFSIKLTSANSKQQAATHLMNAIITSVMCMSCVCVCVLCNEALWIMWFSAIRLSLPTFSLCAPPSRLLQKKLMNALVFRRCWQRAYDFSETDVILSLSSHSLAFSLCVCPMCPAENFGRQKAVVHHFGTKRDEYQFRTPMGNLFTQIWQFVCKFRLHCGQRDVVTKIEIVCQIGE